MHITEVSGGRPGIGADPATEQRAGPAVPRMVLGARLRRLREAQYISAEEAAEAIRVSSAKLSGLERGRRGFVPRDVTDLLTIYGVTDETEHGTMLALAAQANTPGWWRSYGDLVPDWLDTYVGLEQAASVIRTYESQFVPGVLQTPEYARAVISLDHSGGREERLQARVELRMRRRQVLEGAHAPHLWAVIDEAVFARPVGGPGTMRAQLEHLIEVCALPRVTVQVLPFDAGGHAAGGGPVSILRLPQRELPDVVYLEQLLGAQYPDESEDVEHYRHVVDRLVTTAAPATATPGILRRFLNRI